MTQIIHSILQSPLQSELLGALTIGAVGALYAYSKNSQDKEGIILPSLGTGVILGFGASSIMHPNNYAIGAFLFGAVGTAGIVYSKWKEKQRDKKKTTHYREFAITLIGLEICVGTVICAGANKVIEFAQNC